MAEASDSLEILKQNLIDAGCDQKQIDECIKCYKEQNKGKLTSTLKKHKTDLLDSLHQKQKEIDCLDYLYYQINKKENKNE